MITARCIDELADHLRVKAEVSAITRRAMNGELDFVAALQAGSRCSKGCRSRFRAGVPRAHPAHAGARVVQTMRAWRTALVSGGFAPFVGRVGTAVGFDIAQANRLETLNGRSPGVCSVRSAAPRASSPCSGSLPACSGCGRADLAEGDGANDLPMLRAAGLGVAFRPTSAVAAVAPIVIRRRPDRPALPAGYRQERLRVELTRAWPRVRAVGPRPARPWGPPLVDRGYSLPPPPSGCVRLPQERHDLLPRGCRARGRRPSSGAPSPASGKRSATNRRSPWRSTSSRTDFLFSCWA